MQFIIASARSTYISRWPARPETAVAQRLDPGARTGLDDERWCTRPDVSGKRAAAQGRAALSTGRRVRLSSRRRRRLERLRLVWSGCVASVMQPPNDAAISGHRLYARGLRAVLGAGEVLEGQSIAELEQQHQVHPRQDPGLRGRSQTLHRSAQGAQGGGDRVWLTGTPRRHSPAYRCGPSARELSVGYAG